MPTRREFLVETTAVGAAAVLGAPVGASAPGERLKVVVPPFSAEELAELRAAAPGVELVVAGGGDALLAAARDAHGVYGHCSPELIRAAPKLRWIHVPSAGVETLMFPELVNSGVTLTNGQRNWAPEIADQVMGMLLCFTRSLAQFARAQPAGKWERPREVVLDELDGRTLQIIGLGGIGSQVARRAKAFGMRVVGTDPKVQERPAGVDALQRPDAFHDLLPHADVLVSAVPHTPVTRKMVGAREFATLKRTAILVNVSRGPVVDTDALVAALRAGTIAAAALDVTDPEPLPSGHPLWTMPNVLITPHTAGTSPEGFQRAFRLFKEQLRRFAAGEQLLNIVDKRVGY